MPLSISICVSLCLSPSDFFFSFLIIIHALFHSVSFFLCLLYIFLRHPVSPPLSLLLSVYPSLPPHTLIYTQPSICPRKYEYYIEVHTNAATLLSQWESPTVKAYHKSNAPDRSPPLTKRAQHGHYKHGLFGQVVWTMGVKDDPRSFSTSH